MGLYRMKDDIITQWKLTALLIRFYELVVRVALSVRSLIYAGVKLWSPLYFTLFILYD
jgi:hypothetical protein